MVPSNHSFFQYFDSNIGLFSIAPCKVITLNLLCILFGISSLKRKREKKGKRVKGKKKKSGGRKGEKRKKKNREKKDKVNMDI
jgi:hypothetical protein